jgi:hypothetical protein
MMEQEIVFIILEKNAPRIISRSQSVQDVQDTDVRKLTSSLIVYHIIINGLDTGLYRAMISHCGKMIYNLLIFYFDNSHLSNGSQHNKSRIKLLSNCPMVINITNQESNYYQTVQW